MNVPMQEVRAAQRALGITSDALTSATRHYRATRGEYPDPTEDYRPTVSAVLARSYMGEYRTTDGYVVHDPTGISPNGHPTYFVRFGLHKLGTR